MPAPVTTNSESLSRAAGTRTASVTMESPSYFSSRPERSYCGRVLYAVDQGQFSRALSPLAPVAHEFCSCDTNPYTYVLRCCRGRERRPLSADDEFRSRMGATSFSGSPRHFRNHSRQRGGGALTATVVLGLAWGDEGKGRVC